MWTAILGDVSGKGAEAAAITAAARHTLRAAALVEPDPATNLALLNRVLTADLAGSAYCTVAHARLCPGPDCLAVRLANGWHLPPLVLRANGDVEPLLAGHGPLVGMFVDAAFQETELKLMAGDVLLLYTDGVTEIRSGERWLGEQELAATLAEHRGQTAARRVAVARATRPGASSPRVLQTNRRLRHRVRDLMLAAWDRPGLSRDAVVPTARWPAVRRGA